MNATPRTDAKNLEIKKSLYNLKPDWGKAYELLLDFTCTLELELTEALKDKECWLYNARELQNRSMDGSLKRAGHLRELKELREELGKAKHKLSLYVYNPHIEGIDTALQRITAERNTLLADNTKIRADNEKLARAAAEMRTLLLHIKDENYVSILFTWTRHQIDHALSSDAGSEYVHKGEIENSRMLREQIRVADAAYQKLHELNQETLSQLSTIQAREKRLEDGLIAVSDLINDSDGIYGLHLNGDNSPWDELRTGGRYEEWLVDFDDAIKALAKPADTEKE